MALPEPILSTVERGQGRLWTGRQQGTNDVKNTKSRAMLGPSEARFFVLKILLFWLYPLGSTVALNGKLHQQIKNNMKKHVKITTTMEKEKQIQILKWNVKKQKTQ